MEIKKGTIIRTTRTNSDPLTQNTMANVQYDMEVTRVNKNTYTLKGITYNWGCKLYKDAIGKTHTDVYGTKTTYTVLA